MPNYTNSVWSETPPAPRHRPLDGNVSVDVAIVGGGITGVTAARLLKREGLRVAVLESRRLGKGESSKTTAHVTEVLDVRDDLRQVLLGTDHERVLQGAVTRQGGQVAVDLALHALAAARPHPAQPQLHPGKVGERVMLG